MKGLLALATCLYVAFSSATAFAEDAAPATDAAPVITNFKFGLVCGAPGNRRVCFPTNVIQVTNESHCVYNRLPIACTWYGYSYDYTAASDTKIDCEYTTDKVTGLGNMYERLKPASKADAEITLAKGQHHFFLNQYIGGEKQDGVPDHAVDSCSYEGKPLFTAAFQFEFTDPTAPVETVPDMNVRH